MLKLWLAAHWMKLALGLIAAYLIVTQLWSCRADKSDSAQAAVMAERIRVDSLRAIGDSIALAEKDRQLSLAIANAGKTVDRWQTVKVPVYLPATASAHDTITSLAKRLNACYAAGDSLVGSIIPLKTACESFRDTAKKSIADLKEQSAHKDSLLEIVRRGKRLNGYGDLLYEPLKMRPVVGIGGTTRLFWKLDAKAELQFAIPTAKRDSSDGFRFLAGAHIRF